MKRRKNRCRTGMPMHNRAQAEGFANSAKNIGVAVQSSQCSGCGMYHVERTYRAPTIDLASAMGGSMRDPNGRRRARA